jgi:hypothetical protein
VVTHCASDAGRSAGAATDAAPAERVAELLETLVTLGQARQMAEGRFVGQPGGDFLPNSGKLTRTGTNHSDTETRWR